MTFFQKLLLFLCLPLYILDQITKAWTVKNFSEPYPGYFGSSDPAWEIIPGFFHWIRVHNQGVAFGLGNGTSWAPVVFLIVPIIAMVMIRIFWKKGVFEQPTSKVAIALLLCGIIGNLTDRLVQGFLLEYGKDGSFWERLSNGYVVDFIAIKLPLYDKIVPASGGWWPTFNVADSCICIAAVLLFIGGMIDEKMKAKEKKSVPA
ncbi:MAG: signal peptidase II [Akkermansiaceae bacterium]|jgi:signal peptidase II|nr:signal peptidase II [Akkermansiaceae bacterium]MDP4646129.1 signal peptidase II [Akkermansiaceae bacterium]MDP4720928.1 signal peptidase II [Akkermansiaceae bacterium]MDP4780713.1 signal peptidase II [Akkermansiaceae bacterium]MDP4845659.1 signal peptidase II [Akkermansiaceae bacterium]